MKKQSTLLIAILTVLLLVGTSILYNYFSDDVTQELQDQQQSNTTTIAATGDTQTTERELQPAPDFTVYDADGKEFRLSDFKGKPVVVNFWATWCDLCKYEMPAFQEKWEAYGDEVEFLMVNLVDNISETMQSAQDFLSETDYTFPIYFDSDRDAYNTYPLRSIPVTIFVDADGNLVNMARGMLNSIMLDYYMQELLQ